MFGLYETHASFETNKSINLFGKKLVQPILISQIKKHQAFYILELRNSFCERILSKSINEFCWKLMLNPPFKKDETLFNNKILKP